ncbi:hypothetical protein SAMN04488029_0870 [Reichenbachiella faecimaris]|uniref:Uncharacterized protein n=1 Tax=Reichenbachiella faecimaris TaxID=692418 RepID=A0A1W2G770_REIFA|nr:hypothetical protein [Reichenbachiella faecimaris]SMD32525.1 hypothetical protein SAMN04488029_0870 [Reichenbachiella faecimaris]
MKYLHFLFILLLVSFSVQSQTVFSVIHVKGEVKIKSTGIALMRGMKISEKETLVYGSVNDLVAAINPQKGKVILQPTADAHSKNSELAFVIKDIYSPMLGNATTRGSSLLTTIGIVNFFKAGFLVLDENEFEFNERDFPLSDSSFFFVRYSAEKFDEPINKKLPINEGRVLLNRDDFLRIDGNEIDASTLSNFELFYFADNMTNKLANMELYIIPMKEINEVIDVIKTSGIDNPFMECLQYMQIIYGNVDPSRLETIFNER